MTAIEAITEEYESEIRECEGLVNCLKDLDPTNTTDKAFNQGLTDLDAKLTRIKKCRKNLSLELTQVKDRSERAEYTNQVREFDERVAVMTKTLQTMKTARNKQELISGAKDNPYSTEGKSNDELLEGANRIQDLTFESLGRTRVMIEQSKEIGAATVDELRRQRAQIVDIDEEIDHLDSHVSRAEKLVANFTKRIATDKLIQGFTVLNIIIIICIIIYAAVTGKTLSKPKGSNGQKALFDHPSFAPSFAPTMHPTT